MIIVVWKMENIFNINYYSRTNINNQLWATFVSCWRAFWYCVRNA